MLGENLGEPLEEFERPSSVIQDPLGKVILKPFFYFCVNLQSSTVHYILVQRFQVYSPELRVEGYCVRMNFNISRLVCSLIFNSLFSIRLSLGYFSTYRVFFSDSYVVSLAKICIDIHMYLQHGFKVFLIGAIHKQHLTFSAPRGRGSMDKPANAH